MSRSFQLVLPKRVIKNPLPMFAPGGDCGPCIISGLTGIPVREVYNWDHREQKEPFDAFSWPRMRNVLYQLYCHGKLEHVIDRIPLFLENPSACWMWGYPGWTMNLGWFNWMRLAIGAGYYGIATVDSGRRGPIDPKGVFVAGDHWILICGIREVWPEREGAVAQDVLISNSSRAAPDEEWVSCSDFLSKWGGYNILLAKPLKDAS